MKAFYSSPCTGAPVARANGAVVSCSLGQGPRMLGQNIDSAEGAIHSGSMVEPRFQRLAERIGHPWGDAPGFHEIAPLALNECGCGPSDSSSIWSNIHS